MAYLAVPQQKNEQPSAEKEAADKEGEYTRKMQGIFGSEPEVCLDCTVTTSILKE